MSKCLCHHLLHIKVRCIYWPLRQLAFSRPVFLLVRHYLLLVSLQATKHVKYWHGNQIQKPFTKSAPTQFDAVNTFSICCHAFSWKACDLKSETAVLYMKYITGYPDLFTYWLQKGEDWLENVAHCRRGVLSFVRPLLIVYYCMFSNLGLT